MSELFGVEWLPLPRASEMMEIDRVAREEHDIPERLLMENAGRAIAAVVQELYPEGPVVAAVGSGHNGADAFIALRSLRAWGREVTAVRAGSRPPEIALAHRWEVPIADADQAAVRFASAGVVLDGILGTGSTGAPRDPQAAIIRAIEEHAPHVVAVDGPTGVDFSTGAIAGACVTADVTINLGFPKLGLLMQPGRSRCGRILVAEIGFPPVPPQEVAAAVLTPEWARHHLPRRPPDAHKGDAGYLLVVAGRTGMAGAGILVARGALAMGAGIVRIASDAANREIYQTAVPEGIFLDIDDDAALVEAAEWADAMVIGPGLGRDARARERLDRALEATGARPVLLDADALNLFAGRTDDLARMAADRPVGITPHPGEMGRLLGHSIDDVRADPVATARSATHRLGAAVLLKGAPSVVAWAHDPTVVSSAGSSAAAVGGSGDVMAGACGALLAAGLPPHEALAVGLFFCGRATELGPARGRTSLDLAFDLPLALESPGAIRPPWPFILFDQPARV